MLMTMSNDGSQVYMIKYNFYTYYLRKLHTPLPRKWFFHNPLILKYIFFFQKYGFILTNYNL